MKKVSVENPYIEQYDLSNCESEPIHRIQTVQSFAGMISVDIDTWIIKQTSTNIDSFIGFLPKDILNQPLSKVLPKTLMVSLKKAVSINDFSEVVPTILPVIAPGKSQNLLSAYLSDQQLIIEIERDFGIKHNLQMLDKIDKSIQNVHAAKPSSDLFMLATKEIKQVTGYDRVMIYRFDKNFNGEIIAETHEAHLSAFLGVRYPASDIPKQARDLFLANQIRIITNVNDSLSFITPSLHPDTQQPLNVGMSASRGSSPIHLEYLRNMGVKASLTVAIIENGKLWGLIACHHYEGEKILDFRTRNIVRFFAQILAGHLSFSRVAERQRYLLENTKIHDILFKQIDQKKDLVDGLMNSEKTMLNYIPASGAAIVFEKKITRIGLTPEKEKIESLIELLQKEPSNQPIYSSESVKMDLPDWTVNDDEVAGYLAVALSKQSAEYIIWFRQPLKKKFVWGGNPEKAVIKSETQVRLSPRKSFEKWKQIVQHTSNSWGQHEIDAALSLRNDLKEVVLKRFDELKKLHEELQLSYEELETFSYTVSHDLRSPLRTIEGYAQILLEDYSDKLDAYGLEITQVIIESIDQMNKFINDILVLSKLSNANMKKREVVIADLLKNELTNLKFYPLSSPKTQIKILGTLPNIFGDSTMIRQVFYNLLSNAIKYSKAEEEPIVEVEGKIVNNQIVYTFKDNGIGFDMNYSNIIFEVFNRLDVDSEYEGTGIGLSIVKRVVDRHEGRIEVKSELGKGATFTLYFPK